LKKLKIRIDKFKQRCYNAQCKGVISVYEKKDPMTARNDLMKQIGRNLSKLKAVMNWTQSRMSNLTGVAEPTTANYLKGERMPSLEYFITLCNLDEVKDKKIDLRIDDFLSSSFDPGKAQAINSNMAKGLSDISDHRDVAGVYFCYFFDQSKPVNEHMLRGTRELRFGVLTVFDDYNRVTGEKKMKAFASFYKEKEQENAVPVKAELDKIFSSGESVADRNAAIADFYTKLDDGVYIGEVSFTAQHIFISIQSRIHSDNALMILNSPPKRSDSDYIGGVGCIASVAHGRSHMPSAQKIIISRYELKCSFEEIADCLSLSSTVLTASEESEALVSMCKNLFSEESAISKALTDGDKLAIIEGRLNQLVSNFIDKNICCVASVSSEEDKNVYELIRKHSD